MHYFNLQKFQFIDDLNINSISEDTTNLSIIYRNYTKKLKSKELIKIKQYCKKKRIKFYISNNIEECLKYDLDGLYIPAFNKKRLTNNFSENMRPVCSKGPHFCRPPSLFPGFRPSVTG